MPRIKILILYRRTKKMVLYEAYSMAMLEKKYRKETRNSRKFQNSTTPDHQITDDSLFCCLLRCCFCGFICSVVIVVCQVCSTSYNTLLGEERYYYRNATFCKASGAFEVDDSGNKLARKLSKFFLNSHDIFQSIF